MKTSSSIDLTDLEGNLEEIKVGTSFLEAMQLSNSAAALVVLIDVPSKSGSKLVYSSFGIQE